MNDTVPAVSIRAIPAGSAWLRLSGKEKRRSQPRSPRSCHTQLIRCWYSGLGRAFSFHLLNLESNTSPIGHLRPLRRYERRATLKTWTSISSKSSDGVKPLVQTSKT